MEAHVGLDFGGVIVRNWNEVSGEDTCISQGGDGQIGQDGVVDAVRDLVRLCGGRVWIVSKAGSRMQSETIAWLYRTQFFTQTGLNPQNVHFCTKRQEKETICRSLGITHFVDDRIHIMQILRDTVPNLYLFGTGGERGCPPWATYVSSWLEAMIALKASLQTYSTRSENAGE